jgi:hypothetical protein
MKDKINWTTQGTEKSCKYKKSLYAFTTNKSDPKAKTHYIQYHKISRKVIKKVRSNSTVAL